MAKKGEILQETGLWWVGLFGILIREQAFQDSVLDTHIICTSVFHTTLRHFKN